MSCPSIDSCILLVLLSCVALNNTLLFRRNSGIGKPSFVIINCDTSSHLALIRRLANPSNGVFCKLTITSLFLLPSIVTI